MNNLTTNKYRHSKPGYLQTPVGESPTNCVQSTERKRKSGRKAAFDLVFRDHFVQDLVPKTWSEEYPTYQASTAIKTQNRDTQRHFLGSKLQRGIYGQQRG